MSANMFQRQCSLTDDNTELDWKVKETHPGMAYFAGTHKEPRFCNECSLFKYGRTKIGASKTGTCGKFREFTRQRGVPFPENALACKYFTEKGERVVFHRQKQEALF